MKWVDDIRKDFLAAVVFPGMMVAIWVHDLPLARFPVAWVVGLSTVWTLWAFYLQIDTAKREI
jgi:hypothetical protein